MAVALMTQASHASCTDSSGMAEADAPALPLPEDGLLRVDDVLQFVRVSKTTWFGWVRSGVAPRPIKIGGSTFWRAKTLRRWIEKVCSDAND